MSSTNRGGSRSPHDVYNTPPWVARLLLENAIGPGALVGRTVLDAGAGEGSLMLAVKTHEPLCRVIGVEVRDPDDCKPHPGVVGEYIRGDFLSCDLPAADVVIMNPPFRLGLEFVDRALTAAPCVYALMRHGFSRSSKRWQFVRDHLRAIYMLPQRPSFGRGEKADTDSCEYDWMLFERVLPRPGVFEARLLPLVGKEQRVRWGE